MHRQTCLTLLRPVRPAEGPGTGNSLPAACQLLSWGSSLAKKTKEVVFRAPPGTKRSVCDSWSTAGRTKEAGAKLGGWRVSEAKAARAAQLPRMAARCGATSAATCPAGCSPPARSSLACSVHAVLTVDAPASIKDERAKKEIDSISARHERAEFIRRKRDAPVLQSLGSQPPPWKPIAPTAVFGGPVRGFTFSRVCNLRASTPGLSTRAVARPVAHTKCLWVLISVRLLAPVVSLL